MNIIAFATAWGASGGGINSFNYDLLVALKKVEAIDKVICVVPQADDAAVSEAATHQITLVSIGGNANQPLQREAIQNVGHRLRIWGCPSETLVWLGHDLITGEEALLAAKSFGGRAAIIHHMDYKALDLRKKNKGSVTREKIERQSKLFNESIFRFAVGPLLRESCLDIAHRKRVVQLVPGFPVVDPEAAASDRNLSAICFGRLDKASDQTKLGTLTTAAFAKAFEKAHESPTIPSLLNGMLTVMGLSPDDDEIDVKLLAEYHAHRRVPLLALEYETDRRRLMSQVAQSNLAMMLSSHEGFGLVAWEAIAAGVPVIISKNSGVYELIKETDPANGPGLITALDIRGSHGEIAYQDHDLLAATNAVIEVAGSINVYRNKAFRLRDLLTSKLTCTWEHTAGQFLDGIKIDWNGVKFHSAELRVGQTSTRTNLDMRKVKPGVSNNPFPWLANLSVITTQGSAASEFDILPELLFGTVSEDIDGEEISFGLHTAELMIVLSDCSVVIGSRLETGDRRIVEVVPHGAGWRIEGPRNNGILEREVFKKEILSKVNGVPGGQPQVKLMLKFKKRNLRSVVTMDNGHIDINKEKIIGLLIAKGINATPDGDGFHQLCEASLEVDEL